jgi:hypothetical protein
MCKVEFSDSGYKTLGQMRRVNFIDRELFLYFLLERLSHLDDSYVSYPISKIIFTYTVV